MPSFPAALSSSRDVGALEHEVDLLRAELTETKLRLESDVARAKEDALGVMRATGMWSEVILSRLVWAMSGSNWQWLLSLYSIWLL